MACFAKSSAQIGKVLFRGVGFKKSTPTWDGFYLVGCFIKPTFYLVVGLTSGRLISCGSASSRGWGLRKPHLSGWISGHTNVYMVLERAGPPSWVFKQAIRNGQRKILFTLFFCRWNWRVIDLKKLQWIMSGSICQMNTYLANSTCTQGK